MRFVSSYLKQKSIIVPEALISDHQLHQPQPISEITVPPPLPLNKEFNFSKSLQLLLQGKNLLLHEITFPLPEIHQHYLNGYIIYEAAIIKNKAEYICRRCGNNAQHMFASHECGRCGHICTYCRHCITMGKVAQCTPIILWVGPPITYEKRTNVLKWTGELSQGQQVASNEVVRAVNHQTELLVWAVCGAGKTEVLFRGLSSAIEAGKKVLITTPRTDVVLELFPRLKKVFPTITVIALYGNSEDRGKDGQLIISTTHQLIRYREAFDVVVIDEVDAFPYTFDPMLEYVTKQAVKKDSTIIYLSATPNNKMKKQINKGQLQVVKIPKRYHGYPLPVPSIRWMGNWRKSLTRNQVPQVVLLWLKKVFHQNKQVFLFIPSVETLHKLLPIFRVLIEEVEAVHAEDPDRRAKVHAFREGKIKLLLTTTILERGVTVPNVAVAVFGAEDEVFTESALVQIAGRAGRSAEHPNGEVVFFHYGKTKAMVEAIRHIEQMNQIGGV